MNCSETDLLLHAYADGELDVVRSLELELHVKGCPACAARLESLKTLARALRDNDFAYHAPASLRHRVQQMAGAPVAGGLSQPPNLQWIWKWLAAAATAAAVLLLVLRPPGISTGSENNRLLDDAVACHVRSLMAGHLTDVPSSDQHTVKPWFEGKLDFAPDVRDFASQNFSLVGGRLDYLDDHTVAALVYRHNKHLVNVFIWPAQNPPGAPPALAVRKGYCVLTQEIRGFHYCLVSDMDENGVEQLAGLLGR